MANGNTVIPHGLRADLMRKHMENKNTLTRNSNLVGLEMQYCPISIIISSHYSNVDFFKETYLSLAKSNPK